MELLFTLVKELEKSLFKNKKCLLETNVANKYGYEVQILAYWKTNKEAFDHEMLLISCMKDMGIELTNLTDGGEGLSDHKFSESHKKAISTKLKVINKRNGIYF